MENGFFPDSAFLFANFECTGLDRIYAHARANIIFQIERSLCAKSTDSGKMLQKYKTIFVNIDFQKY